MTKKILKLDKEKFTSYLKEQKPRAHAGVPGSRYCCPLANYLKSEGAENPRVGDHEYQVGKPFSNRETLTPYWAVLFIDQVDWGYGEYITYGRCLKIIEDVPDRN